MAPISQQSITDRPVLLLEDFQPGRAVYAHVYGQWRRGRVVRVGRTRVRVRVVANRQGREIERWEHPRWLRKRGEWP